MIEKDFLKRLNILYAEDDDDVRTSLEMTMEKVFNNVYLAQNGQEALEIFEDLKEKGIRLDAIVSDINMPKMNGVEFLKVIRDEYPEMPFIFTTAYSEVEYLLEAIRLDATDYLLKPIELKTLLKKINRACRERQQSEMIQKQKNELERYLRAIDHVAVITKTDLQGHITFANQNFCDVSGYNKDELYGQNHNIVRHPDMTSVIYEKLWSQIQQGETWQGKLKNIAKDGSPYFVNATIIPLYDELSEINEYIGIRFLTTDDELEKREFKRKVIKNIQNTKMKQVQDANQIKNLEQRLEDFSHVRLIEEALEKERLRSSRLNGQVQYYEEEMRTFKRQKEQLIERSNEKVNSAVKKTDDFRAINAKLNVESTQFQQSLEEKTLLATKLQDRVDIQSKTIRDLRDVIKHREDQLAVFENMNNKGKE